MHRLYLKSYRLLTVPGVLAVLLLTPVIARAQGGSMIPVPREVGVIAPDAQIESRNGFSGSVLGYMGYDTNISYGSGDDTTAETQFESAVPGLSMSLIPGIRYVSPQLLESERTGGKVHYGFEIRGIYRQNYSPDKSGIYNDPRFGAHLGGVVIYSPSKLFTIQAYEIFDRYSEPHYMIRDTFTASWDQNQAGVLMRIVPGDGLLETVLRYNMNLYYFEESELSSANKMEHNIQARVSYKFLPNSHLWLTGSYDINQYFENGGVRNSMPIKVAGGVSTPLWTSLALSLGGGYGWGFYASGPAPDTWLAFAGIQYSMSARLKLFFKYEHTFEDSLLGSYSDQNNFTFGATMPFGQNLLFTAQGGYRHLVFASIAHAEPANTENTRVDDIFFADLTLSYKIRKDLVLRAQYKFMTDQTPYRAATPPFPNPGPEFDFPLSIVNNPSFMKHELYLTLAWYF
ncbi:outer membrane beta-barrel protein [Myxococcota bacterium]|nr:outer membrane beta-barrel protein [Myxococcota bacterium]MBU1410312.1 outer membrane beta-barrel protein [Myxococcota bacterium]MBU1509782.1 outer membrane beta-barrel protein [Myxococcota bacterium]